MQAQHSLSSPWQPPSAPKAAAAAPVGARGKGAAAEEADGVGAVATAKPPGIAGTSAVRAVKACPAFLSLNAGPIVNIYPCSEPASSLAQSAAGMLATQSLSHTASGLLEDSEKQQQQRQQQVFATGQLQLPPPPEQQQQQQPTVAEQQQQQQECSIGGGLATANQKCDYQELLPPIYKVRLGRN